MNRRTLLAALAGGGIVFGVEHRNLVSGDDPTIGFGLEDNDIDSTDSPVIDVREEGVLIRGRVGYLSSSCGDIELAHTKFHEQQGGWISSSLQPATRSPCTFDSAS